MSIFRESSQIDGRAAVLERKHLIKALTAPARLHQAFCRRASRGTLFDGVVRRPSFRRKMTRGGAEGPALAWHKLTIIVSTLPWL
jgi:hypothetical protein